MENPINNGFYSNKENMTIQRIHTTFNSLVLFVILILNISIIVKVNNIGKDFRLSSNSEELTSDSGYYSTVIDVNSTQCCCNNHTFNIDLTLEGQQCSSVSRITLNNVFPLTTILDFTTESTTSTTLDASTTESTTSTTLDASTTESTTSTTLDASTTE
ncbi:MAG TPA: hypothetical protein V6C58_10260, partial [Allocoleopsis sp.]